MKEINKEQYISRGFKIIEEFEKPGDEFYFWSCGIKFDNGYSMESNSAGKFWIHLERENDTYDCLIVEELKDTDKLDKLIDAFKNL